MRRTEARLPHLRTIRKRIDDVVRDFDAALALVRNDIGKLASMGARVVALEQGLEELKAAHASTRSLVTTEPEPK